MIDAFSETEWIRFHGIVFNNIFVVNLNVNNTFDYLSKCIYNIAYIYVFLKHYYMINVCISSVFTM